MSGQPIWEQTLPEPYVNPLQDILIISDRYYIACMDAVTLGTYLLEINLSGGQPQRTATFAAMSYPLSVAYTGTEILVQGYDRNEKSTTLNIITPSFELSNTYKYPILEDKEEELIRHLNRTGKRLPFFCGKYTSSASSYYFNGFSNYALSLIFVNPSNGEISGSVSGFRNEEFTNSLHPLETGAFALSGLRYHDSYLLPFVEISTNEVAYIGDVVVNHFPEIAAAPHMVIREYTIAQPLVVYGTQAKNNKLLLYAYDQEQGTLKATTHIGQSNPYEMGDFQFTSDGGMILLAKTYVADRFPRLALFKLSKQEVEERLQ